MQDNFDRKFYIDSNRADIAAVAIALLLTLLIHVGAYFALPYEFKSIKNEGKDDDDLKLQILPPKIEKKRPRFIEANPYGNDNLPSSPDAPESFKNQRAAEMLPDPASKSNRPFVEGETKDSQKIVQGTSSDIDNPSPYEVLKTLERPLVQPAQPSESAELQKQANESKNGDGSQDDREEKNVSANKSEKEAPEKSPNEQTPDADKSDAKKPDAKGESNSTQEEDTAPADGETSREKKSDDDAAIKIPVAKKSDSDTSKRTDRTQSAEKSAARKSQKSETTEIGGTPKPVKSDKFGETSKSSGTSGKSGAENESQKREEKPEQQEQLPAPRPRPTLSMRIPAGPLADNRSHASTRGVISCDSRFSEFGAYQQRMVEAISRQWNLLASKYDLGTAIGSQVVVEYSLNNLGELTKCETPFSNSTNTGRGLCEQAILTTAPYGEWTQEMINSLGAGDQQVRIVFHYR